MEKIGKLKGSTKGTAKAGKKPIMRDQLKGIEKDESLTFVKPQRRRKLKKSIQSPIAHIWQNVCFSNIHLPV